jgi:hypothetical protein
VIVWASWAKRRSRRWGAVGIGALLNAALWYPTSTPDWGRALACAAVVVLLCSGLPHLHRGSRRPVRAVVGVTAAAIIVAGMLAALAMGLAYSSVQAGATSAKSALELARDGDGPAAQSDLAEARTEFEEASSRVSGPLTMPALLVPGLSQQIQAVQTMVDQGDHIASTADDLLTTTKYDQLQYDGRLDLQQVQQLAEPARRVDTTLADAAAATDDLGGTRLLPPLRSRIDEFSDDIAEARRDTALAADLLEVTPGLFGTEGDKRYLVIALASAELRGAGGFVGSYAELTSSNGDVDLTRSGPILDLINVWPPGVRDLHGPADYVERYGRLHPQDFLQDTTYSPHFPSSAAVISDLYGQSGGAAVDGVISVDPAGLASLISLTGPITVPGLSQPLTGENAAEILNRTLYTDVSEEQQNDILAEITRLTFSKLVDSSLPSPRTLGTTLSPAVRGGHIRLWSPEERAEAVFKTLGADGSLALPKGGDGFSVVQQNLGNNKLDAYLQRTVTYEPTVDAATGALTATMRIELTNAVPSLDLPPIVVGNRRAAPIGTNVASLSVFTRSVATAATIDGVEVQLGPGHEQGLNAWDTPAIQIPPGKTVVVEITLEGSLDLESGYGLTILPQPVANPDVFSATLTVANGTVGSDRSTSAVLLEARPLTAPTHLGAEVEQ